MTYKILPCPFCGGKAELWERDLESDNSNGSDGFDVRCLTDSCYLDYGTDSYYDTEIEVISKWNKRA